MTINEFLKLERQIEYDFSNDGADFKYNELDNRKDGLNKFFVYMARANYYEQNEENIMKFGADYTKECKNIYKRVRMHPDSGSELLQDIYRVLWNENILKYCMKADTVTGETLNSQNTTLGILFKLIETEEEKRERANIKTSSGGMQKISIKYIMSRYAKNPEEIRNRFKKVEGIIELISLYHTLGNFMPVPVGCNSPRGTGITKDYWDITLKIIYEYFKKENDNIADIVGENKSQLYKDWLDSYGDDNGCNGWKNFVERNYLQDFVNIIGENYYMPKELWKGHFQGNILPTEVKQIEEFSVNASCFILARSNRMIIQLNVNK